MLIKTNTKIVLLITIICFSFLWGKQTHAAYSDEGVAFYAQTSSLGYAMEGIAFYAPTAAADGLVPVYRFSNSISGDHFFTASEDEKNALINNPSWGYTLEGPAFYAPATQLSGTVPVYRFSNATNGFHFYTASEDEKASIMNNPQWGYAYEGPAFYEYTSQATGTSPVYRLYQSSSGSHFFTASEDEKNTISVSPVYRFVNTVGQHFYTASESEKSILANTKQSGYLFEGIAFYAFSTQVTGTSPVYRLYNSSSGDHFYTISSDEESSLVNNAQSGYALEGVAFYAYPTQTNGSSPVYRLYDSSSGTHFYTDSANERTQLLTPPLGPNISVGLWGYDKSDISDSPFQITANKPYNIIDGNGTILGQVSGNSTTKVEYDGSDGNLKVYGSITSVDVVKTVSFQPTDGDPSIIFDVNRPSSSYDHYRGQIKLQYYHGPDVMGGNTGTTVQQVWVDNIVPLEEYVWGMGETTGTGPIEHTKVMTTIFRTYGFWYIKYANKYAAYGFQIRSDSGSQIYWGQDWESKYPNIKTAAQATRGIIATYGGDVALTPYSSWSAGQTRSATDAGWGSSYPWCQSVKDDYGNYNASYWNNSPSQTQAQLIAAGNHMVGLIAHGSLYLADQKSKTFDWILHYYYNNISLPTNY